MSLPGSPHDKLFKAAFSDPAAASALLHAVLDSDARSGLQVSTLTPLPTAFVDAVLAGSECDLLFACELDGKPGLSLMLLEHKSHGDKWVMLQLLGYELRAWEQWLSTHDGVTLLPMSVVVVVHHGSEPFRGPRQFAELFEAPPGLGRFVPRFEVLVDDLNALDDAALEARGFGDFAHAATALLRDGRVEGRPLATLRTLGERLRRLYGQAGGARAVSLLLEYLFRVTDAEPSAVEAAAQEILPEAKELIMTAAEQLIQRGYEKGRDEGVVKTLTRQLQAKFGPLDASVTARLSAAKAEALDLYVERVLTATSVEAVFAE